MQTEGSSSRALNLRRSVVVLPRRPRPGSMFSIDIISLRDASSRSGPSHRPSMLRHVSPSRRDTSRMTGAVSLRPLGSIRLATACAPIPKVNHLPRRARRFAIPHRPRRLPDPPLFDVISSALAIAQFATRNQKPQQTGSGASRRFRGARCADGGQLAISTKAFRVRRRSIAAPACVTRHSCVCCIVASSHSSCDAPRSRSNSTAPPRR